MFIPVWIDQIQINIYLNLGFKHNTIASTLVQSLYPERAKEIKENGEDWELLIEVIHDQVSMCLEARVLYSPSPPIGAGAKFLAQNDITYSAKQDLLNTPDGTKMAIQRSTSEDISDQLDQAFSQSVL